MANGWVKSLQCKSKAFEDVHHPNPNPNPKTLAPSYSCRKNAQSLKDVFEPRKPKPKPKQKPKGENRKPDPVSLTPAFRSRRGVSGEQFLPALTELPEGHASRNVVEIIFHTSWGPKAFPGRVEMIFKVQNGSRTVFRFEEYREVVKTRSGWRTREENARCVADGNEMMRFYCLGPATATSTADGGGGAWGILAGKGGGAVGSVRTFSGSGAAHESSGGGRGRRAMLVCRVIAGRVGKRGEFGFDSVDVDGRVKIDSVSGDEGELLVFDSRAVLPCFLIFYRL